MGEWNLSITEPITVISYKLISYQFINFMSPWGDIKMKSQGVRCWQSIWPIFTFHVNWYSITRKGFIVDLIEQSWKDFINPDPRFPEMSAQDPGGFLDLAA